MQVTVALSCALISVTGFLTKSSQTEEAHGAAAAQSALADEAVWPLDGDREIDALLTLLENDPAFRPGLETHVELERGGALSMSRGGVSDGYQRVILAPQLEGSLAQDWPAYAVDVYVGSGLVQKRGSTEIYAVQFEHNVDRNTPAFLTATTVSDYGGTDLQGRWSEHPSHRQYCNSVLTRAHLHRVDDLTIRPNLYRHITGDIDSTWMDADYEPTAAFFRRWLMVDESIIRNSTTSRELNRAAWMAMGRSSAIELLARNPVVELRGEGFTAFIIDLERGNRDSRIDLAAEMYGPDGWWFARINIGGEIDQLIDDDTDIDVADVFRKYVKVVPVATKQ